MGFNKKFLHSFDELVDEYNSRGHDEFRRIYLKYDAFLMMDKEKDAFLDKVLRRDEKYIPPKQHVYIKFFSKLSKLFRIEK